MMTYKPTQDELDEIVHCHQLFLNRKKGGKRADLRGADLRGVDLSEANLQGADLWGADLQGAVLTGANLCSACLAGVNLLWSKLKNADLTNVFLVGADLYGADLEEANLTGANLSFAIGNDHEILTVGTNYFYVNITDDQIWINEHHHTWDQWMAFDDDEILKLEANQQDGKFFLEWWREWKPKLSAIINDRKHQRGIIIIDIETAPDFLLKNINVNTLLLFFNLKIIVIKNK